MAGEEFVVFYAMPYSFLLQTKTKSTEYSCPSWIQPKNIHYIESFPLQFYRVFLSTTAELTTVHHHQHHCNYCKSTNFWHAIIFGEFGELRVFANICHANMRKLH